MIDAFQAHREYLNGDFAALLDLLDPDVIARADTYAAPGATPTRLAGARTVARQALAFSHRAEHARVGIVDGAPAILVAPNGRVVTVMTFAIPDSRIVAVDVIADPRRMGRARAGEVLAVRGRRRPWTPRRG